MSRGKKRRGHFERVPKTIENHKAAEELRTDLARLLEPRQPPPNPAGVLAADQDNPPKVKKK